MYAAGREHPHRDASRRLLSLVVEGETAAAIDAEVLQEILHRYTALGRTGDRDAVYEGARGIFDTIVPITPPITDMALELLRGSRRLSARDAIHAAVVLTHDLEAICSFDRGYDDVTGLRRVEPAALLTSRD